jgi:hypothetical protein
MVMPMEFSKPGIATMEARFDAFEVLQILIFTLSHIQKFDLMSNFWMYMR